MWIWIVTKANWSVHVVRVSFGLTSKSLASKVFEISSHSTEKKLLLRPAVVIISITELTWDSKSGMKVLSEVSIKSRNVPRKICFKKLFNFETKALKLFIHYTPNCLLTRCFILWRRWKRWPSRRYQISLSLVGLFGKLFTFSFEICWQKMSYTILVLGRVNTMFISYSNELQIFWILFPFAIILQQVINKVSDQPTVRWMMLVLAIIP